MKIVGVLNMGFVVGITNVRKEGAAQRIRIVCFVENMDYVMIFYVGSILLGFITNLNHKKT
jgi:hypothetical protein